jgi:hypothetical protein
MQIYNYHPETFEFISASEADESPLEPGVFYYPAYSTIEAPLAAGEHEVCIFNPSLKAWEIKADFRGQQLFSTVDGKALDMSQVRPGQTLAELEATPLNRAFDTMIWDGSAWTETEANRLNRHKIYLENEIQKFLDTTARAHNYDGIHSAALRAAYPGPWQAEGLKYALWMDGCWQKAYDVLNAVLEGSREIPTSAELIAELPQLTL